MRPADARRARRSGFPRAGGIRPILNFNTASPPYPNYFTSLTPDAFGDVFLTDSEPLGTGYLGSVLELSGPDHKKLTRLTTFDPDTTGAGPGGGMEYDRYGNLYGASCAGGPLGGGTVFELSGPGHHHLTRLAAFNSDCLQAKPSRPNGSLLVDYAGNIFETNAQGGTVFYFNGQVAGSNGPIYKISADHKTFTTLYKFTCTTDGCNPRSGLVADRAGNLYGTTFYGHQNKGVVFKLSNAGFVPFPQ